MANEKFDLQEFPTSESAQRMLATVTAGFYDNSYVGKWLYQVMGLEYDEARAIIEELPDQMFPETATWGLMYHEIKWNLPVRNHLSYEERRRLIYEKRDNRAPMTPYRMETSLANVTGFAVHVCDVHDDGGYGFVFTHPNIFKVVFIGDGTLDSKEVHKQLDKLKQSHTIYTVNDRTEIILDNRTLESILVSNINVRARIPFWGQALLDGEWLLDGSHLLDTERNYDLRLGLMYREGEFETVQDADIHSVIVCWRQELSESFGGANTRLGFMVPFWSVLTLNGDVLLNGSELLDKCRVDMDTAVAVRLKEDLTTESVENVTCITRRNLAYLDGSLKLDGTRKLNSLYEKEVI